jgi:hypothetical protein
LKTKLLANCRSNNVKLLDTRQRLGSRERIRPSLMPILSERNHCDGSNIRFMDEYLD